MAKIKLIVGLGNYGGQYESTRHNAGFWFADQLVSAYQGSFTLQAKFKAQAAKVAINGQVVHVLKPQTYMNLSADAVRPYAHYFAIEPQEILVVHDELDISPGSLRLKQGGGHGGHNGLRDLDAKLASKDYYRLRIGIGHPRDNPSFNSRDVSNYVLSTPSTDDEIMIDRAIDRALKSINEMIQLDMAAAMNELHQL